MGFDKVSSLYLGHISLGGCIPGYTIRHLRTYGRRDGARTQFSRCSNTEEGAYVLR